MNRRLLMENCKLKLYLLSLLECFEKCRKDSKNREINKFLREVESNIKGALKEVEHDS